MIFQDPLSALNPVHPIGDQIAEMVASHQDVTQGRRRSARDRAARARRHPATRRPGRQYPHEFSGGMRQRAMIAMAIANDPEVLIADEPTTALDVTVQAQILEVHPADPATRCGTAVVFITHDLGVVARIADRVQVMYAGRVVERGGVDDIFYRPDPSVHAGLLAVAPSRRPRAADPDRRARRPTCSSPQSAARSARAARMPSRMCAGRDPRAA